MAPACNKMRRCIPRQSIIRATLCEFRMPRPRKPLEETGDALRSPVVGETSAVGGVAAVDRAIAILETLSKAKDPQSLAALARSTGLYKSTLLRLLASLIHARLVHIQPDDGRYRLGSAVTDLARAYERHLDLRRIVQGPLDRLAAATGESASFFVREGDSRVSIARAEGIQEVRGVSTAGMPLPLDRGAAGRVLSRSDWHRPVDAETLIVATFGERVPELAGIAVPVLGPNSRLIGSVGLAGTVVRFSEDANRIRMNKALLECGRELTVEFGGDVTPFDDALALQSDAPAMTSRKPRKRS